MYRLIACMIASAVQHPFGGSAHIISTDLSQIYVAAFWAGTVELAIVAAVGVALWPRARKFAQRI